MSARIELRRTRRRVVVAIAAVALVSATASCGDDEAAHQLVGYRPSATQSVAAVTLPDASAGDQPFTFAAAPGGLLVTYFGYTSCPDVCPTTLALLKSSLRELGDDGARIRLAMATVDPQRDTGELLTAYVRSFVPTAHALRTDDADQLLAAADSFGASYSVTTDADGRVEVSHSGAMYVVDDSGEVVLTWPFGVTADAITGDLQLLLDEVDAGAAA